MPSIALLQPATDNSEILAMGYQIIAQLCPATKFSDYERAQLTLHQETDAVS